jgi:hypothetical protein
MGTAEFGQEWRCRRGPDSGRPRQTRVDTGPHRVYPGDQDSRKEESGWEPPMAPGERGIGPSGHLHLKVFRS